MHILHIVHIPYVPNILCVLTYSFDLFRFQEQCLVVFPFKNKHDHPFMATGKNHSIRHTPADIINYCNGINASCGAPETAHKDWVKEQGVCTNQGPYVQLTMMMHSLSKDAAALLCNGVQGNTIHIVHILRIHIFCIFCILYYVNVCNIFACFQHESMMAWKRTTGITRITLSGQMYLSGLIAVSNNQMRHCQERTFPDSHQYLEQRKETSIAGPLSIWWWESQPGLPCNETRHNYAWQCW
jgi:hypothetical protein